MAEWLPGVGCYQARMNEEDLQSGVWLTAEGQFSTNHRVLKRKKKKKKDTLGLIVIPLACEATDTKYN